MRRSQTIEQVVRGSCDPPCGTEFLALLRDATCDSSDAGGQQFELLKADPRHPSLHFKRVKRFHSVRVGAHFRALAVDVPDGLLWF